jgi:O-antigen/teichoic acid export membrane protein
MFISTGAISLFVSFFVVSILCFIATMILGPSLDKSFILLLRIGIFALGVQAGFDFIISVVRAERRTQKLGLYTAINSLGGFLLAVGILYFIQLGAAGILLGTSIVTGVILSMEIINFHRRWGIRLSSFSLNLFKSLLSYGMPVAIAAFGASILSIFDRFMIGYFVGSGDVGIYAAGYSISNRSIFLLYSIPLATSYPVIFQTYEKNGAEETKSLIGRILSIYFILIIPAVLGITTLSSHIVNVILGQDFQNASIILPWIAGGIFFLGLTQIATIPFALKKRTFILAAFAMGAAMFNILLNLFLIPKFGGLGAAYATFISYLVYLVAAWAFSHKIMPYIFPFEAFLKCLFATLIMVLSLYFVGYILELDLWTLLLKISLGVVVYFAILFLLKENNVVSLIREFKNRRFVLFRKI